MLFDPLIFSLFIADLFHKLVTGPQQRSTLQQEVNHILSIITTQQTRWVDRILNEFGTSWLQNICACHKFCFGACFLARHKVKTCIFPKITYLTNFVILCIQKNLSDDFSLASSFILSTQYALTCLSTVYFHASLEISVLKRSIVLYKLYWDRIGPTKTNQFCEFCLWVRFGILQVPSQLNYYEVSKDAKIRNRFNQVSHLTRDTNGKVTNSQLDTTN